MMKFRKNQNKEKQIPKEKKPRVYYKVNPHKKVVIALWVLLGLSFSFAFFKLYPTATASELSYYVNDGILKPIGKEYIFQELVNPIHNRKDNQVTVSLTVEYIDQQTKATQVSQFDLVLEKNGSNWKIIE